jgi:hypothetical protein
MPNVADRANAARMLRVTSKAALGASVSKETGVLDPLTGALAQSLAVLAVVGNSARILRFDR